MRDSFVFYRSFADGIRCLNKRDQLTALWDIIDYALDDATPENQGMPEAIFNAVRPQIDKNNKRYQNGLKGGRPKNQTETKPKPNRNQTETKPKPNENVNDNDKRKESTLTGTREKNFHPPTVEEVQAYCQERGISIDAEYFVDFYTSKNWMIGKNKMKDWKAAVRNWNRSNKSSGRQEVTAKPANTNKFNNFENGSYNLDDLERKLLG